MNASRIALAAVVAMALAAPVAAADRTAERPSQSWEEIRGALYAGQTVHNGSGLISLDTPYRAHDAATVPVSITIDPRAGQSVSKMTLLVDENPMPVAAEFEFDPGMGRSIVLSTRVRVDMYSNVRVIAELDDGSLHQFARFVKASGGCSAPALKDAEAAMAQVGKMRLRVFEAAATLPQDGRKEAQVMVRHPNYTGFQVNQLTQLHIPAFFIDEMEVWQGQDRLFRVTGGISLSEDPSIRFRYLSNGATDLKVRASDTDGNIFERAFPVDAGI
ncbi:MAG: quinoprotein dehydrogenase-associated SoxYZ-like carrier [Pseudomonadota bacterium]